MLCMYVCVCIKDVKKVMQYFFNVSISGEKCVFQNNLVTFQPLYSVSDSGIDQPRFSKIDMPSEDVEQEREATGFPKKGARFSNLKNIPDLLSDEKESKIMENIDFSYFSNRASFMGNPVALL